MMPCCLSCRMMTDAKTSGFMSPSEQGTVHAASFLRMVVSLVSL
ncbi:MAG: hypothetical protein ACI3Y5_02990 [Prevotella sp.]